MSAPDPAVALKPDARVRLTPLVADIIEIAAFRNGRETITTIAAGHGVTLPPFGRCTTTAGGWALSTRPDRWLLITDGGTPAVTADVWAAGLAPHGTAIDQSSGFALFHLDGPATREMLARGCRLDLHPSVFAPGTAAATIMAQVNVTLVALPAGMLIATPSTFGRHMAEWFAATAAPFGFEHHPARALSTL